MIDSPVAAFVAAPAAEACSQAPCETGLSAVDLFALAAAKAAAGDLEAAETLLIALTRDPEREYRTEARFRLGQIRERKGDVEGALAAYRALLEEKPDATRVRLDLARLLALKGDEQAARRELRTAGTSGLPEDVARVVDQFAAALRSRRPLGASIEVALAPDSNINAATRQRTIETIISDLPLSEDARGRRGVGLSVSGQAFARLPVAGQSALARLSLDADLYRQARFNDVSASLAVGPEFIFGSARLRPALLGGRRWYGGQPYADSVGLTVNYLRPAGPSAQLEAEATLLDSDYRVAAQDGFVYDGNLAYARALTARTSIRLSGRVTRQGARDPGYATTSFGGQFLLARSWRNWTAFGEVGVARTKADARLFLFPEPRKDRRWDLTAGLVMTGIRFLGASPLVRITHSDSDSTVALYDFSRTRMEFALSRDF